MEEANNAVDAIVIYNGRLASALTGGHLRVYGVVPSGIRQERQLNRLIRTRSLIVWARVEQIIPPLIVIDDITGSTVIDDLTGEIVVDSA